MNDELNDELNNDCSLTGLNGAAQSVLRRTISAFLNIGISRSVMVIASIIIFAAVPIYWIFADVPDFYGLEKRYRATWPEISGSTFLSGKWGDRIDAWMADKMPIREFLVGIDSYAGYFSGRQYARDALADRNGRLVEAPSDFDEGELAKRLDKIAAFSRSLGQNGAGVNTGASIRKDAGANVGDGAGVGVNEGSSAGTGISTGADTGEPPAQPVRSVILLPPNAGYVAPMPQYVKRCYSDDGIAGAITVYIDDNRLTDTGLSYIDLRKPFVESIDPLYYGSDHHWNAGGIYKAYEMLGSTLGYDPLPKDAFEITYISGFYGSTYAKSGLWLSKPDTIELWSPPCRLSVAVTDAAKETDIRDSLFFDEYASDWDKYSLFLGGIHGLTVIENLDYDGGGGIRTLFVIKDSFANSLMPLLIAHCGRIVMIDLRGYRDSVSDLYAQYAAGLGGGAGVDAGADGVADAGTCEVASVGAIADEKAGIDAGVCNDAFLYVYSMNRIANDPDLLWLR